MSLSTSHQHEMQVIHRDDLPLGGFAGLKEHRLVMDAMLFHHHKEPTASNGLGNFVYLADARFIPHGETGMHPHREVDVISIMAEGRIAHGGSLADGQMLVAPQVQVQRAGGEGLTHNEVNPDATMNRMIQIWVLPEERGQAADYKVYDPTPGAVTRVYGGETDQQETFASGTLLDVALLPAGQSVNFDGHQLTYLVRGKGEADGIAVAEGDLIRADGLEFSATADATLVVVRQAE